MDGMSTEEKAKMLAALLAEGAEIKDEAKKYAEKAKEDEKKKIQKEYENRADAHLKGMKGPEIKKNYRNLLISSYKEEKKKSIKNGKKGKKTAEAGNICPANVCFTCEKTEKSPMKNGKNNALKPCGAKCGKNDFCKKHTDEMSLSKYAELRNGVGTEIPHKFQEVFLLATTKNKSAEWVEHIWKTYPKMRPEQ